MSCMPLCRIKHQIFLGGHGGAMAGGEAQFLQMDMASLLMSALQIPVARIASAKPPPVCQV